MEELEQDQSCDYGADVQNYDDHITNECPVRYFRGRGSTRMIAREANWIWRCSGRSLPSFLFLS